MPDDATQSPADHGLWSDATLSRALFEESPFSTVIYDAEGRVLAVNRAFTALWGASVADVPPDYSVLTDPQLDAAGATPIIRRAFEGETVQLPPVRYDIGATSATVPTRVVWTQAQLFPVRDAAGRVRNVVLTHVDLTERIVANEALSASEQRLRTALDAEQQARRSAERSVEQARRLQRLTERLNEASTLEQVADVVLDGGMEAIGADGASLALVRDGDEGPYFETLRSRGFTTDVMRRYTTYPVRRGRPLSDAVLDRRLVIVSSPDQWDTLFPSQEGEIASYGYDAFVAVPVAVGDRTIAGLTFNFRQARQFDEATRAFLSTLGEQCALALDRARLHAAEIALLERNAAVLESIQDGFVALDDELRFTYVNRRAAELLHRTARELIGVHVEEAFAAVQSPFIAALRDVARSREPLVLEDYGTIAGRWLEVRFYPADGSISVFFQDVTERRRAQEASAFLADASRMLASSLDYNATLRAVARLAVPRLGDWCAVDIRVDPYSTEWPPVLERIAVEHQDPEMKALGLEFYQRYPTDWSTGTGIPAVMRTGTPLFVPVITDEMLATGASDPEHLDMLRRLRFSSVIVVPLIARARTLGLLTLCMTESERHYTEADLALAEDLARRAAVAVDNVRLFREAERAREEAIAANTAKTQFLATMSHELRTPLNAIAGYAQLIALGVRGPITPEQRDDLERIQRSQRHLLSLIDDVLNLARIEAGRVEYVIRDVVIDEVLDAVASLTQPLARERGLTLEPALGSPALIARADRERLQQVIVNLVSNAIKFTEPGGHVSISAERRGTAVRIEVRDTGRGIPPDHLERIFEPFVQVESGFTRTVQGSGLGLAIARDLARGMGGEVTVESTYGVGSTFTVTVPAA